MFQLNVDNVQAALQAAVGQDEDMICLDKSIDHEKFKLFMRIMKAEKITDISDISIETIISLYADIADFSEYFYEKPLYADLYRKRINSMPSLFAKRRIL